MASTHAQRRMQQRGVTGRAIGLVTSYGRLDYHRGCEIFYFDKQAVNRIESAAVCCPQELEKITKTYVVMAGEELVTVGYRTCRFKRDRVA